MKKVAITGGKGGTGKSTLAVLTARKLAKNNKVVLCDCDVECPNDYLILGQKLGQLKANTYAEFPKLNKKKCTKCGLCVKVCKNNAIFQKPGEYPVFIKELCSGCGACQAVCPVGAIETQKEETGKIYLNEVDNFLLVTGVAKARIEETGPIVEQTKSFAEKIKADYLILDTAAGTHCPVISALINSDLAYIVTEPTPMGAFDLDLILDLCKKLKVPAEIIINQSDLGDKKYIERIAKKFKVKVKKEIPYSREIIDKYSKGKL
jgi:MinD superfamily P-loop ATPase